MPTLGQPQQLVGYSVSDASHKVAFPFWEPLESDLVGDFGALVALDFGPLVALGPLVDFVETFEMALFGRLGAFVFLLVLADLDDLDPLEESRFLMTTLAVAVAQISAKKRKKILIEFILREVLAVGNNRTDSAFIVILVLAATPENTSNFWHKQPTIRRIEDRPDSSSSMAHHIRWCNDTVYPYRNKAATQFDKNKSMDHHFTLYLPFHDSMAHHI
eukprot:scaffold1912_cov135-Cylindrotheca_fusiformis.AAC.4